MTTSIALCLAALSGIVAALLFQSERDDTLSAFCFVASVLLLMGSLGAVIITAGN